MKIDSTLKLVIAVAALIVGFFLPDIWNFLTSLLGG